MADRLSVFAHLGLLALIHPQPQLCSSASRELRVGLLRTVRSRKASADTLLEGDTVKVQPRAIIVVIASSRLFDIFNFVKLFADHINTFCCRSRPRASCVTTPAITTPAAMLVGS